MPVMKFERRQYAEKAITYLRAALAKHKRVIAVSPTGSGKTVIVSQLVKRETRWRRVLFLAHRYELVDQAYRTLTALGLDVGVMMASDQELHGNERVNPKARVQVGSVQTIAARGVPPGVDLIVFDEAHRTMADSYQSIADACPKAQILGVTATPCRLDGKGLGDFYRDMYVIARPSKLYEDGYLAKPRTYSAPPDVLARLASELKGARSQAGDFAPKSLSDAVDKKYLIGRVVEETLRLAPGVPKVVFACNVAHSKHLARSFKRAGVVAAHVDGATPAEERSALLTALRERDVEVVCNVDVLSEGWDLPALGAVVVARPTKSLARFLQMVGRVQRTFHGKKPIIIDHGANVQRLDCLPGEDLDWSLDAGVDRADGEGQWSRVKVCKQCQSCIPEGCRICPDCDSAQPKTAREEREEVEAQLVEVTATRMAERRARVEALAKQKNAPPGWVDKVIAAFR
jgi:superfamily II DNA or RNA helicase